MGAAKIAGSAAMGTIALPALAWAEEKVEQSVGMELSSWQRGMIQGALVGTVAGVAYSMI